MSQSLANGEVNIMKPTNIKEKLDNIDNSRLDGANNETQKSQTQINQPNVRHIPIFVEGRDQPLYNTNLDSTVVDGPITRPQPPINDIPQAGPIFNLAKDIPVKQVGPEFHKSIQRNSSPARTIPINVLHTSSNKNANNDQQQPQEPLQQQQKAPQQQQQATPRQKINLHEQERRSESPKPSQPGPDVELQKIQKHVLELIDKVDKYKGGSRKDKEYIYLDEMLTQNLLKLDSIDTEGKDYLRAARKDVVNSINKCIQVLESKADAFEKSQVKEISDKNENKTQEIKQDGDGNKESETLKNVAMES